MSSATLNENEKIQLGSTAQSIRTKAFGLGVVCLLAAIIWGAASGDQMKRFFHSYVWNFSYFLSIALGALFFVILQHLCKAEWSVTLRRVAELLMAPFPLLFVLSFIILVPLVGGWGSSYIWADPQITKEGPLAEILSHKTWWLNTPGFALRICIYFAIWCGMSWFFASKSAAQDETGDIALTSSLRAASGPAMIVFAITCALVAFDLLMTLEPAWFSTIFGVYYFAGCALAIMCCLVFVPMFLQAKGFLTHSVTVEHYHDVGKLLFAFVFFWGYIGFSQFMLIWYANMPEETGWFRHRMEFGNGDHIGWGWVSLFLLVFHFAVPFVCLLSRWTKRLSLNFAGKKIPILALFAAWMMFAHWIDLYWLALPSYNPATITFGAVDVLNFLGIGGLFVGAVANAAGKVNLVPTKDPSLGAALRFENQ